MGKLIPIPPRRIENNCGGGRSKLPLTSIAAPIDVWSYAAGSIPASGPGELVRSSRTTPFHEWFIGRRAPGGADHVERVLASLGKSPAPIIARAKSANGERPLKDATDAARKLGIFGAPTFAVGQEIFWGDDRLEEALSFASRR